MGHGRSVEVVLHEAAMLAHDALDLSQWWIGVAIDINGDPLKQFGGINCLSVFGEGGRSGGTVGAAAVATVDVLVFCKELVGESSYFVGTIYLKGASMMLV